MKSFEAWHTHGSEACGKLAWTFIRHPRGTRSNMTSNVVMPDGTHPKPGTHIVCWSCGKAPSLQPELREVESAP